MIPVAVYLAIGVLTLASEKSAAQAETFSDRAEKNHFQLEIKDGELAGSGAAVLEGALSDAQFVLLGEDHGMVQIPQFDSAVCSFLGPKGFHDLAIEVGPVAAENLQQLVTTKDGRSKLAAFDKEFPETIAFYNWAEEYEFLSHCSQTASGGKFQLWGLDQELMGAARILLTRISQQHLSAAAGTEVRHLIEENDVAHDKAMKSGDPFDLFMMSASDAELAHFRNTLAHEGNPGLPKMLDGLLESREIYHKFQENLGFESNRQRALLMKHNFLEDYGLASEDDPSPSKVIFKFGGEHLYKGFNPLHNNDIGNMISEFADYQRTESVHILLLGVNGKQARFAGVGRPTEGADFNLAQDKDSDFLFLKPLFAKTGSQGMTVFDLRAFRRGFSSLGEVDREMERLIFGYDFLVLIPNATASTAIQ